MFLRYDQNHIYIQTEERKHAQIAPPVGWQLGFDDAPVLLAEAEIPGIAAHFTCHLTNVNPPTVQVRGRYQDGIMLSTETHINRGGTVSRGEELVALDQQRNRHKIPWEEIQIQNLTNHIAGLDRFLQWLRLSPEGGQDCSEQIQQENDLAKKMRDAEFEMIRTRALLAAQNRKKR